MNENEFFEHLFAYLTVAFLIGVAIKDLLQWYLFSSSGALIMSFFVTRWFLKAKRS